MQQSMPLLRALVGHYFIASAYVVHPPTLRKKPKWRESLLSFFYFMVTWPEVAECRGSVPKRTRRSGMLKPNEGKRITVPRK